MWLRDSLPKDLTSKETARPMARVMVYGYHSPVHNSSSFQNISDISGTFRQAIEGTLSLDNLKPLIVVGHSLGGLVIKQASHD